MSNRSLADRTRRLHKIGFASILLVCLMMVFSGCQGMLGDDDDDPSANVVFHRTIGEIYNISTDGKQAYLVALDWQFGFQILAAVDERAQMVWSIPIGIATESMVGPDGYIYVATGVGIQKFSPNGDKQSYIAPNAQKHLAWHPWGLPMSYDEGVRVFDRNGETILEGLESYTIYEMVSSDTGVIYAIAALTEPAEGANETSLLLMEMTPSFDINWTLQIAMKAANAEAGTLATGLIVTKDQVIAGGLGVTYALKHGETETAWSVATSGAMIMDGDGVVYVSNNGTVAIDPHGEIKWQNNELKRVTLIQEGLGAMMIHQPSSFGSAHLYLGQVDKQTGEPFTRKLWEDVQYYYPPVILEGRLVGFASAVNVITGPNPDGDIFGSMETFSYIGAPLSAGTDDGLWNGASGLGNRRAMPLSESIPASSDDIVGLWVAVDEFRVRAIQLEKEGAASALTYGLWDYDAREAPRLVEVGNWSYQDEQLHLTSERRAQGVQGRTPLNVHPARPGVLSMEDPLQEVVRPFARAKNLPRVHHILDPPTLEWMREDYIEQQHATYLHYPDADGATWTFEQSESPLKPNLLKRWHDDEVTHEREVFHVQAMRQDGGGMRLYGVRETESSAPYFSTLVKPTSDGGVEFQDIQPWPTRNDLTQFDEKLLGSSAYMKPLPNQDVLMMGFLTTQSTEGTNVVSLFDRQGKEKWSQVWDGVSVLDAVANDEDGQVYILGHEKLPHGLPDPLREIVEAVVRPRYLMTLSLADGTPKAVKVLGSQVFPSGVLAALPQGGVALGYSVNFNPIGWWNPGHGIVDGIEDGGVMTVTSYTRDLDPLWTSVVSVAARRQQGAQISPEGITVDAYGNLYVYGYLMGALKVDGRVIGGKGLSALGISFTPCGDLLPTRWFASDRLQFHDLYIDETGKIFAAGEAKSDIVEPPFFLPFTGVLSTLNVPQWWTNPVVMRLQASPELQSEKNGFMCMEPVVAPSILRVDHPAPTRGRIVSDPPGIDCPGACEATFDNLQEVTLSVTSKNPHTWTDLYSTMGANARCTTEGACTVSMAQNTTLLAQFSPYAITKYTKLPSAVSQVSRFASRGQWGNWIAATWTPLSTPSGDSIAGGSGFLQLDTQGRVVGSTQISGPITHAIISEDGYIASSQSSGTAYTLTVHDPNGESLWDVALPKGSGLTTDVHIAFHEEDNTVAVSWYAHGPIEIAGVQKEVQGAAFGLFDRDTGALIRLQSLGMQFGSGATELRKNILGGYSLRATSSTLQLSSPPWQEMDIALGASVVAWISMDSEGEFLTVRGVSSSTAPILQRGAVRSFTDGTLPAGSVGRQVFYDEEDVPRVEFFSIGDQAYAINGGYMVTNVLGINLNAPVTNLNEQHFPIVFYGSDGRLRGYWKTSPSDEIKVVGAVPISKGVQVLVQYKKLRNLDGQLLDDQAGIAVITFEEVVP